MRVDVIRGFTTCVLVRFTSDEKLHSSASHITQHAFKVDC